MTGGIGFDPGDDVDMQDCPPTVRPVWWFALGTLAGAVGALVAVVALK